jgi:hypothetical protein
MIISFRLIGDDVVFILRAEPEQLEAFAQQHSGPEQHHPAVIDGNAQPFANLLSAQSVHLATHKRIGASRGQIGKAEVEMISVRPETRNFGRDQGLRKILTQAYT